MLKLRTNTSHHRLLSERGDANGSGIAAGIVQQLSPAQLLEQIIHHEAVHEVDGWDDLRRRLQPGARLERLNAQANLAPKGLKQSAGLMVNDLDDLSRIEICHARFVRSRVVHSRALSALL